jgi:hypothetical protein
MRVEFAHEIFARDGPMPPIVKVMECVTVGRHDWAADPQTLDAAERYFKNHAPTVGPAYLELGRKGLVDAVWQPPDTTASVHITLSNLADVAEDLCKPAVLVVEDHHSDGCFVRAIAKVFRAERILHALSRGWLVIRHAGGERLVTVAEVDRRTFCCEVRVVALLDSDRWFPLQRTRAHDKADELQKLGVLVHVLELREAEKAAGKHSGALVLEHLLVWLFRRREHYPNQIRASRDAKLRGWCWRAKLRRPNRASVP